MVPHDYGEQFVHRQRETGINATFISSNSSIFEQPSDILLLQSEHHAEALLEELHISRSHSSISLNPKSAILQVATSHFRLTDSDG